MDSFPPTPTPMPEPLPTHRHFLNKKFALALALVLVCAGAAYASLWYWQNQNSNAVVPSATPNQNSVDTSTWKTYNSQNSFELKYPSNLQLTENDPVKQSTSGGIYISYASIKINNTSEIEIGVLDPNLSYLPNDPNHNVTQYRARKR